MLISLVRGTILYLVLILSMRLMGKRQLGQMEPSEFVVTMLLANLAAVPMQETGTPLVSGLIPILVVVALEILLSAAVYYSTHLRRFFCGKPVILMENGRLLQENLKKTRVSPDELTGYLRLKGVLDLQTVQYAILETSGEISVFLYPKYAPASAKDAGIAASKQTLPITVIQGGRIQHQNLALCGRTEAWVQQTVKNYGCRVENVYLLTVEPGGRLYFAAAGEMKQ